ncbi:MAG: NAD(P)/FAD-dependent oxidoreductase [Nitrospinota bacterium]
MSKTNRVVVVGGGIIGTTAACFLAREGREVVLLDRDAIARGTTAKNTGVLALCSRPADHRGALALFGRTLYEALRLELSEDFMVDRRGTMVVLSPDMGMGMEYLENTRRRMTALGADAEILDAKEVKRRAPGLGIEPLGALLDPSGTLVDTEAIARAMGADAVLRGAEIREYEPVRAILTRGGRVSGVRTVKREIEAEAVVLAAGVWSPFLTQDLGIQLPVVPRRGQLLVTEQTQVVSPHLIQSASYVLDKTAGEGRGEEVMPRFRFSFTLQQHGPGHCVLGSTREFAGYDERLTDEGRTAIREAAHRWFPGVSRLRIDREVAGLRPWMPDHHPVVGPSTQVEGLWYATGHEGDGINLAPTTGWVLAAWMAGRSPEIPDADLSLLLPGRLGL